MVVLIVGIVVTRHTRCDVNVVYNQYTRYTGNTHSSACSGGKHYGQCKVTVDSRRHNLYAIDARAIGIQGQRM